MLLNAGNWGYFVGAIGILLLTVSYLVIVDRWWKDLLGLVLGAVLITVSSVIATSTIRLWMPDIAGWFLYLRVAVFWAFALAVWSGLGLFLWAQFFAPRIKQRKDK